MRIGSYAWPLSRRVTPAFAPSKQEFALAGACVAKIALAGTVMILPGVPRAAIGRAHTRAPSRKLERDRRTTASREAIAACGAGIAGGTRDKAREAADPRS